MSRHTAPTHLKLLRGNPGKEVLPKGEPQPLIPDEVPDPPQALSKTAQDEWWRIAPELHRLGILTIADLRPLAAYCQTYARWIDCEAALADAALVKVSSMGGEVVNPLLRIAERAAHDMMKYAAEFGFTPSSRTKVSCSAPVPPSKFDGLLANQT
jgi:P27 family predicted phage terminase small subunit